MKLEQKIKEYKGLKKMKRSLDERIQWLRLDIMRELTVNQSKSGLIKQERKVVTYNEPAAWDLIYGKYSSLEAMTFQKRALDEAAVEQAYLAGELSDGDLREIREVRIIEALVEVEEGDQDIQIEDESMDQR